MRAAAAWTLGRRASPGGAEVAALATALGDASEIVRDEAASALGRTLAADGRAELREMARRALLPRCAIP